MGRRRGRLSAGFVLTLELILLITVLLIGTIAGWILIRDELVELLINQRRFSVRVFDANDAYIGTAVNYDLCESPQIIYRDAGPDTTAYAILFGVRPDRFVTRDRIYYSGPNCTGTPYIASPGDASLPVGWLNAVQGKSYGVGAPSDWGTASCPALPCSTGGTLYRSTDDPAAPVSISSRWISLNPDCANTAGAGSGGTTGELVANPSFEPTSAATDGQTVNSAPDWSIGGNAGIFNPAAVATGLGGGAEGPHFNDGAPPANNPTQNVPADVHTLYSNGGTATQAVSGLLTGATCTLSVWLGARLDAISAHEPDLLPQTYSVTLAGHPSATLSGTLTPAPPEWQQVSSTFTATGSGPFTLSLTAGGPQVNFDLVSLTCAATASATPSTEICENFGPEVISLRAAEEVTVTVGTTDQNIFADFEPLFWVPTLGPVAELTYTEPTPESEGLDGTPGTPETIIDVSQDPVPEAEGLGSTP